jgi:exosome complex component RRP46
MRALAIGTSIAVSPGGEWVVDPSFEEERQARAVWGVGWAFGAGMGVGSEEGKKKESGNEVVWFEGWGEFDIDEVSFGRSYGLYRMRRQVGGAS